MKNTTQHAANIVIFMSKALLFNILTASCGATQDKLSTSSVYSTISLTSSTAAESKSYAFTTLNTCVFNPSTGLFELTTSGSSGLQLFIKIKGFSKTKYSYTCTQPTDNQTFPDMGSYYNSCSVDLTIPHPTNTSSTNTYSTYRKDQTVKSFSYNGACNIAIDFPQSSTVQGNIICNDLIQTHLESGIRNPIVSEVKASITEGSTFTCNL